MSLMDEAEEMAEEQTTAERINAIEKSSEAGTDGGSGSQAERSGGPDEGSEGGVFGDKEKAGESPKRDRGDQENYGGQRVQTSVSEKMDTMEKQVDSIVEKMEKEYSRAKSLADQLETAVKKRPSTWKIGAALIAVTMGMFLPKITTQIPGTRSMRITYQEQQVIEERQEEGASKMTEEEKEQLSDILEKARKQRQE